MALWYYLEFLHEVFITIIKTGLPGFKKYPFIFMR